MKETPERELLRLLEQQKKVTDSRLLKVISDRIAELRKQIARF
jgi:hypothetical protein